MREKKRRLFLVLFLLLSLVGGYAYEAYGDSKNKVESPDIGVLGIAENGDLDTVATRRATEVLETLEVKGRAPKTDYRRSQFGEGWARAGRCDMRNFILQRDLTDVIVKSETDCTVQSGTLDDPYTGKKITFIRGPQTSDDVQIDHVVALSDAWQKGAQQLSASDREALANDSLNLLAVEGKVNSDKSDSDAATWLPPNKSYRCRYVARQVAVKAKYRLWVTSAEKSAIQKVLNTCPEQLLPIVEGDKAT